MGSALRIDVITIFPGMLRGFLEESMLKRAVHAGIVTINVVDLRDFTHDARRTVDDRPYGGGPGMILKPEPLVEAIEAIRTPATRVIMMTPRGRRFDQAIAQQLSQEEHLVFLCGHYEGVDERVCQTWVNDELSIGDYVLTHGVLPAAVVIDAAVRLIPGVLGGGSEATQDESFTEGLLEYPQYTRPPEYRGQRVPEILLGGNHQAIAAWRHEEAVKLTAARRPDLLETAEDGQKED
jgi:tRNA (guanine37-N1)-methyltransferase